MSEAVRPARRVRALAGLVAVIGLAAPAVLAQGNEAAGRPAEGGEAVAGRLHHLRDHLLAHPEARAQDAYKLLHQSVFGPAHLIPDRAAAARYLAEEWSTMGPALPGEVMLEPLADDPPLVRVNLRPYRDAGGDPDGLVDALVATANTVRGAPALLAACLGGAVGVVRELRGEAEAAALEKLTASAAEHGYPALHHSPGYAAAYRPTYRVVLRPLLPAGRRDRGAGVR